MNSKLSTWKAKVLSFIGCVTLVKSILSSVPAYAMQVLKIPKNICKSIRILFGKEIIMLEK